MITYHINGAQISSALGIEIINLKDEYAGISTIDQLENNTLCFIKNIKEKHKIIIEKSKKCLIFTESLDEFEFDTVVVEDARLAMTKILNYINQLDNQSLNISNNAFIHPDAKLDDDVVVGDFVYIDKNVVIGKNTIIKQGVRILRNTKIGDNSIIRENSVIGGQGFGVQKDENGNNIKIPHMGGVVIGSYVEIGALNTVVSGTINPTIISDYTKTDDHVHIAHNCKLGRNCIITAGVIFSGSVRVGSNVWIGPNSTIKNSKEISDDVLIGIGTLVTKNIEVNNSIIAGVPGKYFDDFKKEKNAVNFLINNLENIESLIRKDL